MSAVSSLPPAERVAYDAATYHPTCVVCGGENGDGLGVRFEAGADGSVRGRFPCAARYQGYPGILHGGVTAMLLDAAMTHCMFARGVEAVTARLNVEYRRPVAVETVALVRARLRADQSPLYHLEAVLVQEGEVRASASAVFFKLDRPSPESDC